MTQPCAMCRSGVLTPNAADIYIGRLNPNLLGYKGQLAWQQVELEGSGIRIQVAVFGFQLFDEAVWGRVLLDIQVLAGS